MCKKNGFILLSLFLVFGQLHPFISYSQEAPSLPVYASELSRLKVISARLQAISIALELKLSNSEKNLQALSEELEALRIELQGLRNQLETSLQKSETLAEMLAKSEASLEKLTESFKAYRREAEIKIVRLEKQVSFWSILGKVALCIIAGETAYITINSLIK